MRLSFTRGLGTTLVLLAIVGFTAAAAALISHFTSPPRSEKPNGLIALEARESQDKENLIEFIQQRGDFGAIAEPEPPLDPDAPRPAATRLYNNLLDNLLSGLHYFFRVSKETPPSKFVVSWDAETGARVISGEARLFALENDISYLLTLEIYRRLHSKAVFDDDLAFARQRVEDVFSEDWHTLLEWPLGPYFDLIELYNITGEQKYLDWAERYAAGDGPEDTNTPLTKAKSLSFQFQYNLARQGSPVYFFYAALLADWGKRNDPALINQSRFLFAGLKDLLYDSHFKMLWKQVSVSSDGSTSRNVTQIFDTMEQFMAIHAILKYEEASGDPEALSLARAILQGVWDPSSTSPLFIEPPEGMPETTFFGLNTAYDHGREAERLDPDGKTLVQILLFNTNVAVNAATRGELRNDVDFLASWLEDNGPIYRQEANGYYVTYGEDWTDPEILQVSSKASIWMSRGLVMDEWYRYKQAQALSTGAIGDIL